MMGMDGSRFDRVEPDLIELSFAAGIAYPEPVLETVGRMVLIGNQRGVVIRVMFTRHSTDVTIAPMGPPLP